MVAARSKTLGASLTSEEMHSRQWVHAFIELGAYFREIEVICRLILESLSASFLPAAVFLQEVRHFEVSLPIQRIPVSSAMRSACLSEYLFQQMVCWVRRTAKILSKLVRV